MFLQVVYSTILLAKRVCIETGILGLVLPTQLWVLSGNYTQPYPIVCCLKKLFSPNRLHRKYIFCHLYGDIWVRHGHEAGTGLRNYGNRTGHMEEQEAPPCRQSWRLPLRGFLVEQRGEAGPLASRFRRASTPGTSVTSR